MSEERVLIEQAIARGWGLERICLEMWVHPRTVNQVWDAMDAAVAEDARGAA